MDEVNRSYRHGVGNFLDDPLERQSPNKQVGLLLILADFHQRPSSWSIPLFAVPIWLIRVVVVVVVAVVTALFAGGFLGGTLVPHDLLGGRPRFRSRHDSSLLRTRSFPALYCQCFSHQF